MTPAQIQAKRKKIHAKYNVLHNQMMELQAACTHPNATKEHKSDTGNWCPADDCYWTDFSCPDCGRRWTVDGSV